MNGTVKRGAVVGAGTIFLLGLAGCSPAPPAWDEIAGRARARFAEQSRQSLGFSEAETLDRLGTSPRNGFSYRLDENLPGTFLPEPDEATAPGDERRRFEFEEADGAFLVRGTAAEFENGGIVLVAARGGYLVTRGDLDLNREEVEEIEVRLKTDREGAFRLGWSAQTFTEWIETGMGIADIPAEPGGGFHVYRLNARDLLKKKIPPGGKLRKLFLEPSDRPGARVEIDYIRLLGREDKYARRPRGSGMVTVGGVMKKALWARVPGALSWEVALPQEKLSFRTGIGILKDGPVNYSVVVRDGKGETELVGGSLGDASGWSEPVGADLSDWAGQTVSLTLRAGAEAANTIFWSNPVIRQEPIERFNAIVILEDALRADRLGAYGCPAPVSPRSDELAKHGILFETAVSQATMTRPSCPSLMTSLYPSATGVKDFQDSLDERFLTLAEVMRRQGFVTGAFIQNVAAGPAAGLQQGYSELYDQEMCGYKPRDIFSGMVERWIERNADANFFLYLHVLDPHGPYNPPPPFDASFREYTGPRTPVKGNRPGLALDPEGIDDPSREGRRLRYEGEVADNDYWIGRFLDALEKAGLLENTLLVVLADHGEFLGEDGRWGHSPPGKLPAIHVPLILHYPARWREGRRISFPVQLLDVMPTVLELAGVPPDKLLLQGESLLPLIEGGRTGDLLFRPVFSEEVSQLRGVPDRRGLGSVISGRRHYLFSASLGEEGDRRRRAETYEIAEAGEIPVDAPGEASAQAQRLLSDLQAACAAVNANILGGTEKVRRHDPEVDRKLKALGYLQ